MDLNYQHLYYFWVVARASSLTSAAQRLQLSPSTISTQIKTLEEKLGHTLFDRRGRRLLLTERGRVALAYANDIFSLGNELVEIVQSKEISPNHIYRLRVGIANNFPKLLAYQLLAPAIHCDTFPVHLVCIQDEANSLVADLAIHHLDLVLTDQLVTLSSENPIENRLIGQCNVSLMGTKELNSKYKKNFPASLMNAPLLLPAPDSQMRRLLEIYFQKLNIRPHVVAEFGDSALLKSFGQEGAGLFPVPSLVCPQVAQQYNVEELAVLEGLTEKIYAVFSMGREETPAMQAILAKAALTLMGS